MGYLVISSFEDTATGDLQAQGEAVAVFSSEPAARTHFDARAAALAAAVSTAREADAGATFVHWVLLLEMPLEVDDIEQALEDLELVLEETETPDDPFGELVLAYTGQRHAPGATSDLAEADALRRLEAWLT